jgi:ribulose-5-phosphate 4-epimerase/fuculose-1-phosphate aldolase
MDDIQALVSISKYAGSRFDLVQAGGGNTSVRLADGTLLIKSSGIALSEVEAQHGYARVDAGQVAAILRNPNIIQAESDRQRDQMAEAIVKQATLQPYAKASMEIYLHVLLHRVTLHTHPLAVAHLMIGSDAQALSRQLFPYAAFIPYAGPGIALALKIQEGVALYEKQNKRLPKRILLANHGLIISADDAAEVRALTEETVRIIEAHLGLDYSHYRLATDVMDALQPLSGNGVVCHVSEDGVLKHMLETRPELIFSPPTMPDQFVYNGLYPLKLESLAQEAIAHYQKQTGELPKVIVYKGQLFFINRSIRKAREMEEVFKFHVLSLSKAAAPRVLAADDLAFLSNSDAETYRKLL